MKKFKLGELLDATRGVSLSGSHYASTGQVKRLTLANFDYSNNGFKPDTSKDNIFYNGEVAEKFILEKGDIITPLTEQTPGLLGTTAMIPESGTYIQSQDVCLLKPFAGKLDAKFAYYLVSSKSVRDQLAARSQQTKIRHSSPDKIKDCSVFIPDVPAQEQIGKLLFSIDDKIALNRKKIEKLEALAKTIYDYWFVQFDFPDANGRPYKSSGGKMVYNPILKREIPVGWEVKRLGDCIGGVPRTRRVPTKEYLSMGNIPIIDQEVGSYIVGYTNDEDARLKIESCVVFGDHSCAVKYVNFDFARGADGTQIINSLIPKQLDNLQIYLYLKTTQFDAGYKRHFYDLKQRYVTVSNEVDLVARFQNVSRDAFSLIKELTIANLRLNSLRDFLLPLLMNGQVEIGE